MTWTFSVLSDDGVEVSAALPDPEFSEAWTDTRRILAVQSDGGQAFTQDLGVEDRFLDATWNGLAADEWSDVRRVIRAAGYMRKLVTLTVSGTARFPVPIATDLEACGEALATDDGWETGDTVLADAFVLIGRLDQPSVQWEHLREGRAVLAIRFRFEGDPLVAGG